MCVGRGQSRGRRGGEPADGPDPITDSQWCYENVAGVPAYSYQQDEDHWLLHWLIQGIFLNEGMNGWMQTCQQALKTMKRTRSLFEEGINVSHLPETQMYVCNAGMLHGAEWHKSKFPSDSHVDRLLLVLNFVWLFHDIQEIKSCPRGVCLVKKAFSEERWGTQLLLDGMYQPMVVVPVVILKHSQLMVGNFQCQK